MLLWAALLLGGAKVVSIVTFHTGLGGAGAGVGLFSYRFRCTLSPEPNFNEETVGGMLIIEGRAPKRFRLFGGTSPAYEAVSMGWWLNAGVTSGESEGRANLNLVNDKIEVSGRSSPLDASNLKEILRLSDSQPNNEFISNLLNFLSECRSGELPRPRHHTRQLDKPIKGYMQHFAIGYSIRYPILCWVGLWLIILAVFYTSKRITSRAS